MTVSNLEDFTKHKEELRRQYYDFAVAEINKLFPSPDDNYKRQLYINELQHLIEKTRSNNFNKTRKNANKNRKSN